MRIYELVNALVTKASEEIGFDEVKEAITMVEYDLEYEYSLSDTSAEISAEAAEKVVMAVLMWKKNTLENVL